MTTIFNYVCATVAGLLVFALDLAAHSPDRSPWPRNLPWPWWISACLALIIPALPFIVARAAAGRKNLETITGAIIVGTAAGVLSMPLAFTFPWVSGRPAAAEDIGYVLTFITFFRSSWPLFAGAGATGGLAYWTAARISTPRSRLSRRNLARVAVPGTLIAGLLLALNWFSPNTPSRSGATTQPIVLDAEIPMRGHAEGLAWSPDGQVWAAHAPRQGWLAICDTNGENLREFDLPPGPAGTPPVFTTDGQRLVFAGRTGETPDAVFSAIDAQSGESIYLAKDPAPGPDGRAASDVVLAASANGAVLAVAFGPARPDQPITLYSTKDWRKQVALTLPPDVRGGVRRIAFTRDGDVIGFQVADRFLTVRAVTGDILYKADVTRHDASMSPDGTMLAMTDGTAVRIVRLSDGGELAANPGHPAIGTELAWDPRQRYLAFVDRQDNVHFWIPFENGGREIRFQMRPPVGGIAFSPDGTRVAVANGGAISFFTRH